MAKVNYEWKQVKSKYSQRLYKLIFFPHSCVFFSCCDDNSYWISLTNIGTHGQRVKFSLTTYKLTDGTNVWIVICD